MLGSNNYLGLTGDERVVAGARAALDTYGTGLTGSRFLNGTIPLHLDLEREIAEWMGTEDALVFTTGHQANVGTLGTILGPGDTVIADSADHASILDGCLLSRAKLRVFRHGRLDKLETQLPRASDEDGGVLVVVDGVFSMEGDVAPLPEIAALAKRYGARLMVDEAHAAGVLGERGAGTSELLGVEDLVDLRMGTFSKSLASCGGFIAGPGEVIEFLRFSSRAFMFTAAAVPAAVGAALAALRIVRSDEGRELMGQVLANAGLLSDGLRERGFKVVEGHGATGDRADHDADRAGARRGRLEGGAVVEGALRGRSLRQRRRPSGRPAGRRAAAHQRDGHAHVGDDRARARHLRRRQARVRDPAQPAAGPRVPRPTGLRPTPSAAAPACVEMAAKSAPACPVFHKF